MKPTLDLIVANTGYSKSTVSRVLNDKADVNRIPKETVKAIKAEADRLGYVPNIVDKKLRTEKNRNIGLVVPFLSNPYFAELANVVITQAQSYGFTTIIADSKENEQTQNTAITSLLLGKVDGLLVVPSGQNHLFLEQTDEKHVPVVLVDRYYEGSRLPYVASNNYKGAYEATMTLIREGHSKIACIQGPHDASPNRKRVEGYLAALKDADIEDKAIIVGNEFSVNGGYIETKLLLNSDEDHRPTAIFALSNTTGLGVIKAIKENNMNIPEDISLISFDNYIYMDYIDPPITRVCQIIEDMGTLAVKLLMDKVLNNRDINSQIELAPTLLLRNSIAPNFA